ncbi:MAG TPA: hypothetical protein VFS92_10075, partial [Planctomycetota bacterium]|nr:hypothetical protein [Planctomycetota bacterium]
MTRALLPYGIAVLAALCGCASPAASVLHESPAAPAVAEPPVAPMTVEVEVVHADGSPAAEVEVALTRLAGGERFGRVAAARSGSDRTLSFALPTSGRYRLAVLSSPGVFDGWLRVEERWSEQVEFDVAAGEPAGRRVRLVSPRPGRLEAALPLAPGQEYRGGVSLARLWSDGSLRTYHAQPSVATREDGGVRTSSWEGLPEGRWWLRAWNLGFRSASSWVVVEAGRTARVEFPALDPAPPIEVRYEGPRPTKPRARPEVNFHLNPVDPRSLDFTFGQIP